AFTAIYGSINGLTERDVDAVLELDKAVEEFAKTTLPARILAEHRYQRRTGHFPQMSVLLYSYFTYGLQQVLSVFDPRRILLVTLDDVVVQARLGAELHRFLGVERDSASLPRTNSSESFGGGIDAHEKQVAAGLLDQSLRRDTAQVFQLIASQPLLDLALFSRESLYQGV